MCFFFFFFFNEGLLNVMFMAFSSESGARLLKFKTQRKTQSFFLSAVYSFLQGSDKIGITEGPLSKRKYQENTHTLFIHVCIIYTL